MSAAPCAGPGCPALATRGDWCQVHAPKSDEPQAGPLRAVCAWCKKTVREGVEPVTHTICKGCAGGWELEAQADIAEIDALRAKRARIAAMYRGGGERCCESF